MFGWVVVAVSETVSFIKLISYINLYTVLKATLLMYREDIKRFLSKIDLSEAKKIAVEDILLCSHI